MEFDPVVLSSFALFWIAYRFGWRAGAVSLLLLNSADVNSTTKYQQIDMIEYNRYYSNNTELFF